MFVLLCMYVYVLPCQQLFIYSAPKAHAVNYLITRSRVGIQQ